MFLIFVNYDSVTIDVRVVMRNLESQQCINCATNRTVLLTSLQYNGEVHIKPN